MTDLMDILQNRWIKIQGKKGITPLSPLLVVFSFLYGFGVRLRLNKYRKLKRRSLPGFVVSIGNLTTGGTGKTPAACMLAKWASGQGYRVAILSRGYGGRSKKRVLEVSDGNVLIARQAEAGDEPYLMAKKLKKVPVVISKKRYVAGLLAYDRFKTNFFILDDGFQHLALRRDLNLVLIDALNPFGNGRLLPRGPLREPVDGLERADAFVITRSERAEDHKTLKIINHRQSSDELKEILERKFPGRPIFRSDHLPEQIIFPTKYKTYDPEFLKGKRVLAFAGIARPEVFADTLNRLGAEVVFFRGFRDHHPYRHHEIQDLITKKERLQADFLMTTEKDWVRMENLMVEYPDLGYLAIKFTILPEADTFFKMVKDRLVEFGMGNMEMRTGNKIL